MAQTEQARRDMLAARQRTRAREQRERDNLAESRPPCPICHDTVIAPQWPYRTGEIDFKGGFAAHNLKVKT